MSNIQTTSAIENALIKGDLAQLSPEQRLSYYKSVCESVGLNPLTKPFEYITLNGKLVLYATRGCTDQLRTIHKVSIKITAREKFEDIYIVTAQATNSEGRYDESTGAVNVSGSKGEALANAYLKAETKAKRRVTLSLCGLGLLDESEVESISEPKQFQETEVSMAGKSLTGAELKAEMNKPTNKPSSVGHILAKGYVKGRPLETLTRGECENYLNYFTKDSEEKTLVAERLQFLKSAPTQNEDSSQSGPVFNEDEPMPM